MSKVEIEKRGRVARVHTRVADMLVQRFGYQRRDMQAQAAAALPADSQALEAKRAAAQAKRDAAAAAKAAAQDAPKDATKNAAKKAAKKAASKTAASTPAPDKDASE
ncbi:hypothetical protein [Stenotrophomonas sp. SORGH_AS_0321]|uniref:hypothetical protein n=1 Tax=Stenotrophomonas sp. SORGH_AS_0321 TaxID=3041787 RepID=UPI0028669E6F|nr:hypothetical protein [Stenotrophomonas sp. SORGH_AS_0321]MDR6094901.1 microcystin-dependent protein [Stenotrophomonas sp. SORGH_AS_0321]